MCHVLKGKFKILEMLDIVYLASVISIIGIGNLNNKITPIFTFKYVHMTGYIIFEIDITSRVP